LPTSVEGKDRRKKGRSEIHQTAKRVGALVYAVFDTIFIVPNIEYPLYNPVPPFSVPCSSFRLLSPLFLFSLLPLFSIFLYYRTLKSDPPESSTKPLVHAAPRRNSNYVLEVSPE
jgi:hypothetical protein